MLKLSFSSRGSGIVTLNVSCTLSETSSTGNLLINSVYSPAQGGGSSAMAYEPRLNQGDRADYIDIVGQAVRLYLEVFFLLLRYNH